MENEKKNIVVCSSIKEFIHLIGENCFFHTNKLKGKFYAKLILLGLLLLDINSVTVNAETLDKQLENFDLENDEQLNHISSEGLEQILVATQSNIEASNNQKLFLAKLTPSEKVFPTSPNHIENYTFTKEDYIFEANFLIASAKLEDSIEFEAFLQRHMFTEEKLTEIIVDYLFHENIVNLDNGLAKIKAIVNQSNSDKIEEILEMYNLTYDQFNEVMCVAMAEGREYDSNIHNYEESYNEIYYVINNIYNRTISNTWIHYVSSCLNEEDAGKSLYGQIRCPGQYSTYYCSRMKDYLSMDKTDLPGYQAVIDFLYTKEIKHDYLSFRSNGCTNLPRNAVHLTECGNWYFDSIPVDDYYIEETEEIEETKDREKIFQKKMDSTSEIL